MIPTDVTTLISDIAGLLGFKVANSSDVWASLEEIRAKLQGSLKADLGVALASNAAEPVLIATAVKAHNGDYGAAIVALQTAKLEPLRAQGYNNRKAVEVATERWPMIFAVA